MMKVNAIYCCDVLEGLRGLPDKSVNSCITSPPYWNLRDYGYSEQWGQEETYFEYLEHLWQFADELYRVLKDDGTAWINLGDSYNGSGHGYLSEITGKQATNKGTLYMADKPPANTKAQKMNAKCLMLIPHRFAIGCIDRGWIVRNDIVWAKRNAMPESMDDRFSKKHEYVFFMVKKPDYYFDLDSIRDKSSSTSKTYKAINTIQETYAVSNGRNRAGNNEDGKNPGDVADFWDITTTPSADEHYASYNTKLIDKPIIAGCPKDGIIIDPFCGTATTLLRAIELGRKAIGFDGSEKYVNAGNKKLQYLLSQTTLF